MAGMDGSTGSREACGGYFKARPEFGRIFAAMRKKWESLGRTAGTVTLEAGTEEERRALEGFLGRAMTGERLRFSLAEFEKALGETRFGAVSLKELLEAYSGEALATNRERLEQRKSREDRFWEELEYQAGRILAGNEPDSQEAAAWVREMGQEKTGGYSLVMKEYRKSEESARALVLQVVRCLELCRRSEPPGIRLAVLAARITGSPHALDRQSPAGTLLSWALARREGSGFPPNARSWKALYEKNGILVDELSSTVAAYGIHLVTDQGRHPAWEGYWQMREPGLLSLAGLTRVQAAYGESKDIWIVENEMVFSELLERLSGYPAAVLCTSGQPRTAAYGLLELLCRKDSGHTFWYAGDLDPEGLAIAQRIWNSFPDRVRIWRMGAEDYGKAMSQEAVSRRRLELLDNLTHPVLKKTAECIGRQKMAGYQELLLDELVRDILEGAADGLILERIEPWTEKKS